MRWRFVLLILALIAVSEVRTLAQEFSTARFELWIHPGLHVRPAMGRSPDPDDTGSRDKLVPCATTFVGFSPRARKLSKYGPPEWVERVYRKTIPKKHELSIRNDDYFPKALVVHEGDSLVDLEFEKLNGAERLNGLRFEGLTMNMAYGRADEEYVVRRAEPRPVKITNDTHRRRLCYLFVMDHSLGGITNSDGLLKLSDLPCDVPLPMEILFPWLEKPEYRLESNSIKFDENGHFNIIVKSESDNKYVISILPAEPIKQEQE